MNRRDLLKGLMAGGILTAAGLWVPGAKTISIPSGKVFRGHLFDMVGQDIRYVGPPDKTVTTTEFYNWLINQSGDVMRENVYDTEKPHMVTLKDGYRLINPEYLTEGSLSQCRGDAPEGQEAMREYWSCVNSLGDDVIVADKVYRPDYYGLPRERIREDEDGLKGWR